MNIDDDPTDPCVAVNETVCRPASAIVAARADVNYMIHVHGHGVMGVAALECGLLPISEAAFPFYNDIGYIDGDFYFDDDYVAAIPKSLGSHKALIYRRLLNTPDAADDSFRAHLLGALTLYKPNSIARTSDAY